MYLQNQWENLNICLHIIQDQKIRKIVNFLESPRKFQEILVNPRKAQKILQKVLKMQKNRQTIFQKLFEKIFRNFLKKFFEKIFENFSKTFFDIFYSEQDARKTKHNRSGFLEIWSWSMTHGYLRRYGHFIFGPFPEFRENGHPPKWAISGKFLEKAKC